MRAGPLADEQVIKLLNSCFVPVYISNEDYNSDGSASEAEKKERNRIWHEAAQKKLSSGTVHAYLLTPAGEVFDSMHVAEASGTPKLLAMLEKAVESQKVAAGKTLAPPVPQSACPKCAAGQLSLHLVARGSGGGNGKGSWRAFPGENWMVLDAEESAPFRPRADAKPGQEWNIDPTVSAKILTYFYPQTENNDTPVSRLIEQHLHAKLIEVRDGIAHVRLDGLVRLKHSFYPNRKDETEVRAPVVGWVEVDMKSHAIRSLRLATDDAKYGKEPIYVAVQLAK
jgi:hypothetical protein